MPIRRNYRKKPFTKKRVYRKRRSYGPPTSRLALKTYSIIKSVYKDTWQSYDTATMPVFFSESFRLDQLTDYSSISDLYDEYMICGVRIELYPPQNVSIGPAAMAVAPVNPIIMVHWVVDYTSTASFTTVNQVMEYQNVKSMYMDKKRSMYIKHPRTQGNVVAGTTATRTSPPTWLPTVGGQTAIHYGIGGVISGSVAGTSTIRFPARYTYYLKFRNPR